MSEGRGAEHYGAEWAENDGAKAERIVREVSKRRKWTEAGLWSRAKGEAEGVQIARRLRAELVMTAA